MGTLTFVSAIMFTFPLLAFGFVWIVARHVMQGERDLPFISSSHLAPSDNAMLCGGSER